MKKLLLTILFIQALSFCASAQYKIGINVLPFLSANRVSSDMDSIQFNNEGTTFKFGLGMMFDIEMKENYYFNTGVYWFPKNVGLNVRTPEGTFVETFTLQYLQLPLILKLFTDEFSIDKRFFFQVGPTFDVKISESKSENQGQIYIDKFNFIDINLNIGVGIDIKLGNNTSFYGGISYYRGLLNAISATGPADGNVKVKNDMYALNLGIKF